MSHLQEHNHTPCLQDPVENDDIFPVSYAQQRLWLLDRLLGIGGLYNISWAVRLNGKLDVPALQQSLKAIVARHESLRTCFVEQNGEPVQVIRTSIPFACALIELPQENRASEIQRRLQTEANKPFDLKQAPLIRALLLRLSEQEHILMVTLHHSISDGWSMGVFRQELASFYRAFSQGQSADLPELPIQYADYAVWQREWLQGEVLERQLSYWKSQLTGLAVLELPTDKPRPKQLTYRGAQADIQLSAALTRRLKTLSRQQHVTLFITLSAALQVLLHRYSGQDDIVLGTAIAGRNRQELENLIGFFVNTLVLRTDLSGAPGFNELLSRVRKTCSDAYSHQDLPFEKLVAELNVPRDASRHPLFQVMLILQPATQDLQLPGLTISRLAVPHSTAKFDILMSLREYPDGLTGTIEYSTDLFNAGTINQLIGHFQTLLEAIVEAPETSIAKLPLLTAAERQQLLVEWNATQSDYPKDSCIHQLFEQQVARTPDAIALVFEGRQLSYQALNDKANHLAYYLRTLGVQADSLVAICLERSIDLVIGLLAILKAGGAYLPLDPAYPLERLAFMLDDSKASLLLTQKKFASVTNALTLNNGIQPIYLDSALPESLPILPEVDLDCANLAYVIYTSGSTGKPKGVQINHRSMVNFLTAMAKLLDINGQDVLLGLTTPSFDIAGLEIYLPLICGAKTVIVSHDLFTAEGWSGLTKTLQQTDAITLMQATPAAWHLLLAAGWAGNPQLKILCGGEALPHDLALRLRKKSKALWNLYGPTETTVWSSVQRLSGNTFLTGVTPIGRPIANTQFYILDRHLQPVPVGVAGELHIGGDGLARGYLNRPELSAEKFIANPFSNDIQERLYKTGDLARYLPDGTVEFLGRIDQQIKLHGHRIELGEIEAVLLQYSGIAGAAVIMREDQPGDQRLTAYLVPEMQDNPPDAAVMRQFLKEKLPSYMLPSAFVIVESIPLLPNGKLDRHALPKPEQTPQTSEDTFTAPQGKLERQLARIWKKILRIPSVGRHDNFFDLGGYSFLFFQLTVFIEKELAISFPANGLLQSYTIEEQAIHLQSITNSAQSQQKNQYGMADNDFKRLLTYANGKKEKQHPDHPLIFPYNEHLSGIPLYFVNGGKYLGAHIKNRPFYDLISGFNIIQLNENNFSSLADYYAGEILKLNPSGPYLLGGYCSGGLLAFEIATRLLAKQKSVPLLIMVDQSLPCTYSGNIAFLLFHENGLINELSRLDQSDILKQYYPGGWTLDIIESQHYPELYYISAMIVAERIESRIKNILENERVEPLPDLAKQCNIQAELHEQSVQKIIFMVEITNCSQILWPAGQLSITHHWLSNLGRAILYAENKVTLDIALKPGQKCSTFYHVNKLNESAEAILRFCVVDKFGTWFETGCNIIITRDIHSYDSPALDLANIDQLEEQGNLTQAIQYYHQYLHTCEHNSATILIKLAEITRYARGAQDALIINKRALIKCSTNKERAQVYQNLAENYFALEDFEQTIIHARDALKNNHTDYLSLSYLGLAYVHKRNYSKAISIFNKISCHFKEHYPEYISTGMHSFAKEISKNISKTNYNYIINFTKKLLDTDPYKPINYYIHVKNLIAVERYDEAEQVALDGVQTYPYLTAGYETLHFIYMQQQQLSEAIAMKYKICELKPFCIEQHKQLLHLLQHELEPRLQDVLDLQKKLHALQ
ncbi:amino acid adenylation domain-containing protein [Methylobacter svalbardensis]|uniref:amino acid adenylation domain-containing protein n=1 Tax=Methylobacter svalbardensis TaxID=3080016 RepID=UPI0030ED6F61